jgi:hypothetical protein
VVGRHAVLLGIFRIVDLLHTKKPAKGRCEGRNFYLYRGLNVKVIHSAKVTSILDAYLIAIHCCSKLIVMRRSASPLADKG